MLETVNLIESLIRDLPVSDQQMLAAHLKEKDIYFNVYRNPTPVAVAVVPVVSSNGSLKWLGVQRNVPPAIGKLTFPGGYVDMLETAEAAASRELSEETGIAIAPQHFSPFASKSTLQNNMLIFCKSSVVLHEGDIQFEFNNAETQKLTLLDRHSLLGFPTHQEILELLTG